MQLILKLCQFFVWAKYLDNCWRYEENVLSLIKVVKKLTEKIPNKSPKKKESIVHNNIFLSLFVLFISYLESVFSECLFGFLKSAKKPFSLTRYANEAKLSKNEMEDEPNENALITTDLL